WLRLKLFLSGRTIMTRGRCRPKHILSSPARGSMLTEHFQSQKKTMTLSMLGWRAMPPHRTVGP
ncbi:hypothetical protein M514_20987, partial [Trichuris suis]